MRISAKWLLAFLGIGVYVMTLGGVFCYNLFRWTFDEQLKRETLNLVLVYKPDLLEGLQRNPDAITMKEFSIMQSLAKDERVTQLVYLNRYGYVRWHKDPASINLSFDEYKKNYPVLTNAIHQAFLSKTPKIRSLTRDKLSLYETAIPLANRQEVTGIVSMEVSRAGVQETIRSAMQKYVIGATGIILFLGVTLLIVLNRFVLHPLQMLKEGMDSLSVRNLELKLPKRSDEIGGLAGSLQGLLGRMRTEMETSKSKEKQREHWEQKRWESIVLAVAGGRHAIIADENNNILYTNFPVAESLGVRSEGSRLHLLDVVDSQQQDLLRLVNRALENPNQLVEGDTDFKNQPCHVRIINLEDQGEDRRTLIFFEPKQEPSITAKPTASREQGLFGTFG